MGDIVSDETSFSCTLCTGQLKIKVLASSAQGSSKKLANTGNYLFPPPAGANCLLIPNAPAPCAPPNVSVVTPGQTAVSIDGKKALGAGCKLQCAKGGLLSVASPGQTVAKHGGAASGGALEAITTAAVAATIHPEEKQEEKKSAKEKNKENKQRDGTPKNNEAQNKQFKSATKQIEKEIGRKLSKDEVRRLHNEISKQNLSYHEIVDEGVLMFS